MSLYSMLAPVYDRLFPVNPETMAFLESIWAKVPNGSSIPPRRAFDAGSATGSHVLALAERGWGAVGIEPESEMVAASKERAARAGSKGAAFFEGDMRDARALLGEGSGGSFGLGLCLGNTLPHLPDLEALDEFLAEARALLAPGGALVLQLLNYARVGPGSAFAFPELRADGLVMRRRYEGGSGGRLRFVVELENEGAPAGREETLLTPLPPAILLSALGRAGYPDVALFGLWSGAAFDEGRDAYLIAAARA